MVAEAYHRTIVELKVSEVLHGEWSDSVFHFRMPAGVLEDGGVALVPPNPRPPEAGDTLIAFFNERGSVLDIADYANAILYAVEDCDTRVAVNSRRQLVTLASSDPAVKLEVVARRGQPLADKDCGDAAPFESVARWAASTTPAGGSQ